MSIFFLSVLLSVLHVRNHCLTQSYTFTLIFCSKNFILFTFKFKFMIQLGLFFFHMSYEVRVHISFFYSIFSPTITYWKQYSFPIEFSWQSCQNQHIIIVKIYYWTQFYSDLHIYSYIVLIIIADLVLKVRSVSLPNLFFFSKLFWLFLVQHIPVWTLKSSCQFLE